MNFARSVKILSALALLALHTPADAEWKGKGELGIVFANGNTDTETLNAKIEMATELDRWKHGFSLAGLKASSNNLTTAQRYAAGWQSDFKLTERSYWFGALRYEDDRFSGFDYQASASTGYGYKLIDTETTKLSAQAGVGYRKLKDALTGATSGDAILRGDIGFEHLLTSTTKLLDKLVVESGSDNTFAGNDLALEVKMSDALALAVGVGVRYNTDPPVGLKKTDTLTTVNLVYAF
ncbi:MAG: DUF481 domain-containing protein [Steroidobacteraceae bacterium]